MATDILQCKEYAAIDCEDNYDILAVDNVSSSINNQTDLPGDNDDYDVLAVDNVSSSINNQTYLPGDNDDYDILAVDNISNSINNQADLTGDDDVYEDLANDRLPCSISTKDLPNQVNDEVTIQEPADNTLNEDLNQTNIDDDIRQGNGISKKRLVGSIIGIVCFITAATLLIVSLWYTQLKNGIEISMSTIGSGNSTDLITKGYTVKYENVTDTDDIVTKVDTVSVIKQAVSDKSNVNVTKVDTVSVTKQAVSNKQKYAKTKTNYSALIKAKFDLKNKFNISCMKMLLVKDKIWCAFMRNLHIYNRDSMIGKKVEYPIQNIMGVKGLAQAHTGHIILATGDGLLEMLESGQYVGKIEGGRFHVVCSFKKKLYAKIYKRTPVLVYKRQTDNWIKLDRITFRVKRVNLLLSNGNHLYVCSRMMVHVYDKLMQRIGKISTAHFDKGGLTFCGVDGEGRFLLINKQEIFIGNGKEKWHKINIALDGRDSRMLRYAALDWFNGRMLVATGYRISYYDIIV